MPGVPSLRGFAPQTPTLARCVKVPATAARSPPRRPPAPSDTDRGIPSSSASRRACARPARSPAAPSSGRRRCAIAGSGRRSCWRWSRSVDSSNRVRTMRPPSSRSGSFLAVGLQLRHRHLVVRADADAVDVVPFLAVDGQLPGQLAAVVLAVRQQHEDLARLAIVLAAPRRARSSARRRCWCRAASADPARSSPGRTPPCRGRASGTTGSTSCRRSRRGRRDRCSPACS